MDCTRVDGELVGFELGALDGATRAAVEAHLVGCPRCVSAYLALKRAIDAGEEAERPSEVARARVRQAAQQALAATATAPAATTATATAPPAQKRPRRAVWALAVTAAAALVLAPLVWRSTRTTATAPSAATRSGTDSAAALPAHEAVDTARTTPENLSYL